MTLRGFCSEGWGMLKKLWLSVLAQPESQFLHLRTGDLWLLEKGLSLAMLLCLGGYEPSQQQNQEVLHEPS